MTERKSNLELAKHFYKHHQLEFRLAMAAKDTEERQFDFTADRFDDWAVVEGSMSKRACDADEREHGSILFERHRLRVRMNRAARKGEGLPRAFTIEARNQLWRVVLLEKFVTEQPAAIVRGIQQCLERSDKTADQVKAYLQAQEHLSDEERLRNLMRLDMAQMSIFNGLQMMELVIMGFQADRPPNLKRLRRKMAQVLLRETQAAAKRRPRRSA